MMRRFRIVGLVVATLLVAGCSWFSDDDAKALEPLKLVDIDTTVDVRKVWSAKLGDDAELRLRRGHGQTQEEMFRIKYDQLRRIPDLVVFPKNDEEVASLVRAAGTHNVSLIPYGGGTNVSNSLTCPETEDEVAER